MISRPPSRGCGYGDADRSSVLHPHTATSAPRSERAAPSAGSTAPTESGHSGGSQPAPSTSPIRTNCATTQRSPRSSAEVDDSCIVEALLANGLDELRGRSGVEGERHQRLPAPSATRDGHVRDV